jgi:hypothetical protein
MMHHHLSVACEGSGGILRRLNGYLHFYSFFEKNANTYHFPHNELS